MPANVTVVGSINVDLVIRARTLPAPGETVIGGTFERHGGGKGANAAVAAARLGADVRLLAAVGDDDLGHAALVELSREEVDVTNVVTLEGISTGVALIVVAASGENQIAVASGANLALRGADVAAAIAAGPRGGVCLLGFEVSDDVVVSAAEAAHAAGMRLILNPAPARALPAELVRLGPILTPNRRELTTIAEADTEAAAHELAIQTGAPVVVTLGPEGVLLVDADGAERIPGHEVAVVDTTGAGDAFSGAIAAGLASGATTREAARRANVAAALSVTASGAREGMPDRATLERALA
jgi:ribokinase